MWYNRNYQWDSRELYFLKLVNVTLINLICLVKQFHNSSSVKDDDEVGRIYYNRMEDEPRLYLTTHNRWSVSITNKFNSFSPKKHLPLSRNTDQWFCYYFSILTDLFCFGFCVYFSSERFVNCRNITFCFITLS